MPWSARVVPFIAILFLAGCTATAQTTWCYMAPVKIENNDQLKAAVGKRISIEGVAIGGGDEKLPSQLDCGFYTFQIPELGDWPDGVRHLKLSVTASLKWQEPRVSPPLPPYLQTGPAGLLAGYYYLEGIQWSSGARDELSDIVAPTKADGLKDLLGHHVLIFGVTSHDMYDFYLTSSFYRFRVMDPVNLEWGKPGMKMYAIGVLCWSDPIVLKKSDGSTKLLREGYFGLTDIHWIPECP